MSQQIPAPRLLVVEDDPVSAGFFREALSTMPAEVDVAADIAQAMRQVQVCRYDALLIDAHLPDGDGAQCLDSLRSHADCSALAVTAGASEQEQQALMAAGFIEVLLKPLSISALQSSVRTVLGDHSRDSAPLCGKLPVWDEARALAAIGGNRTALHALRGLFLDELPSMCQQLRAAQAHGDEQRLRALLHKLTASCGFVGAARLSGIVEELKRTPLDAENMDRFGFAASDALEWPRDQP